MSQLYLRMLVVNSVAMLTFAFKGTGIFVRYVSNLFIDLIFIFGHKLFSASYFETPYTVFNCRK